MNKPLTIYLAGPISGCTYGECTDWREGMARQLKPRGIEALSPMRCKDYLAGVQKIEGSYPELGPLASDRGIMSRDSWDCHRADMVVFNLLDAPKVSIGTIMELAWAWKRGTPTIVIMESTGNVHDHPMVREATSFRVATIEEAFHTILAVANR